MSYTTRLYLAITILALFCAALILTGCDSNPQQPVKIENGIPTPTPGSGRHGKWKDILVQTPRGSSFFLTTKQLNGQSASSVSETIIKSARNLNMTAVTQQTDKGLRVWRVK